jgi:hypothetical protein
MSEKHPKPTRAHKRRQRRNGVGTNRGGLDLGEQLQAQRAAQSDAHWREKLERWVLVLKEKPNSLPAKLAVEEARRELKRRGLTE